MKHLFIIEPWGCLTRGTFPELPDAVENHWFWNQPPGPGLMISERITEFIGRMTWDADPTLDVQFKVVTHRWEGIRQKDWRCKHCGERRQHPNHEGHW